MKIVLTKDGSNTIFLENIGEFYHSPRGAISESKYVFIENGIGFFLNKNPQKKISILEIGLGTGLNAFLSMLYAEENEIKINYHSIEKYPIPNDINKQLNYSEINLKKFIDIIDAEWNKSIELSPYFNLYKEEIDIKDFDSNNHFDIVFFDAFAKAKQEEMWNDELLMKILNLIKSKGIFVSYAAISTLNKLLKENNFILHKRKGALGKREMTLAEKD